MSQRSLWTAPEPLLGCQHFCVTFRYATVIHTVLSSVQIKIKHFCSAVQFYFRRLFARNSPHHFGGTTKIIQRRRRFVQRAGKNALLFLSHIFRMTFAGDSAKIVARRNVPAVQSYTLKHKTIDEKTFEITIPYCEYLQFKQFKGNTIPDIKSRFYCQRSSSYGTRIPCMTVFPVRPISTVT